MQKPKDTKKKDLSPNHINHVKNMLKVFKGSSLTHPLAVPPSQDAGEGGGDDQLIPAKTGEYVIPKPVVDRKGTQFFDSLVKKTLEELMPADMAAKGGTGTAATGFKWGGEVEEKGNWRQANQSWAQAGRSVGNQSFDNPGDIPPWQEPDPLPSPAPNPFGQPDPNVFINHEPRWAGSGLDPKLGNNFFSANPWYNPNTNLNFGYNPFGMSQNFRGSTMLPTFWDKQGYPFAIPYYGSSADASAGTPNHIGQPKDNS